MVRLRFRSATRLLGLAAACLIPSPMASAGQLTTGNLIITVDDFTGHTNPPTYLAEYNTGGTRIQTISTIPVPPNDNGSQEARGTVLSPDAKAIYVFNASADQQPYLAAYNVPGNSWAQQTTANWGGSSSTVDGGVGVYGPYVFASNANSADGGLLRFNTSTSTVDHFGPIPFTNIINLSVSSAGTVFALDGQSNVYEYNASTLALENTFAIKFQQNEVVAGASDGSFYVATAQGEIDRYSATGTLLKSITVTNNLLNGITTPDFFDSIAINEATGQIALGTANHGQVVLTDLALDTPTAFVATDPTTSFDSGNVHVAWVTAASVPEPSTVALLGIAVVLVAAHPRARAARPKSRA
jgi:PEP-CTERM motif